MIVPKTTLKRTWPWQSEAVRRVCDSQEYVDAEMSCFMMFLLADVSQDEQQSDREKQHSNDHQRSHDPAPVVLVCVRQYWVLHDENVQHSGHNTRPPD